MFSAPFFFYWKGGKNVPSWVRSQFGPMYAFIQYDLQCHNLLFWLYSTAYQGLIQANFTAITAAHFRSFLNKGPFHITAFFPLHFQCQFITSRKFNNTVVSALQLSVWTTWFNIWHWPKQPGTSKVSVTVLSSKDLLVISKETFSTCNFFL